MCTVTLVPQGKNNFILTSNRDEAPDRVSLTPEFYNINGTQVLFPKDKMGGTWIGVSEKNRVVCVLNGGFVKHERATNYRKSRGVVANDFMVAEDIVKTIEAYDLDNIEPFTMVIVDWNATLKFYELGLDGAYKYFIQLPLDAMIWSSSTLYSESMQRERQQWFENFETFSDLNAETLLEFHNAKDDENLDYGVIMNRGFVKTTSITQVEKQENAVGMRYENLETNVVTTKTFTIPQVVNG